MKKSARFFLVLIALCGLATAFADVGGHTKPTGGRQDSTYLCQLEADWMNTTPTIMCADF